MKSSRKKTTGLFSFLLFIFLFIVSSTLSARDYYQIKIYNIKNSDQEVRVDNYLKNAYLPAMHRAGIKKVGVFKPIADDPAAGKKIFVFIPLKKIGDIEKIGEKLANDKVLQIKGAEYINAKYDNPPYERLESILLQAFPKKPDFSVPVFSTPDSEQIFELRSYEGATEKIHQKKVEMFNEGGEVAIFNKLEFNPVFFSEVISGSAMPNLMYMTTFPDMKSHDEHWDAFSNSPDWTKLKGMEEYTNTVSHIDKYLMHPTEYSDI